MSDAFTPLQRRCIDAYCGGEFRALDSMQQVYGAGDTLLTFVMAEAAGMSGHYDMRAALVRAIDELFHVYHQLEKPQ